MESPVVLDKPPEYHGNERGFPFDEEEGSAWSELASRHPDIAARLRQRPATWARKRRPSSQDATDDFGDSFGEFDRFPFDDIPPEFREHFPSRWNRRFGSREEQPTSPTHHQPQSPQQQTAGTQTESKPGPSDHEEQQLPQYGLRNTVDLGQKSPADPSLVDAEDRTHRSMSAPPDNRSANQQSNRMSGQHPQDHSPQQEQSSNVRHIPIFVEGRDEPIINRTADHGTHFGETKPAYVPPSQPHIDRDQYFADDTPHGFHHPPNFSRSFGTPFNKGFRQGPQPFSQQKMYPQNAFARGTSPQRSQSPKPQMHPEEHFVKVPVYHEQTAPPPSKPQPKQPSPQRASQPSPQQAPQAPPQPKPQPSANDPITQILSIQSDVLNLMTEVENFSGNKKDKKYVYLDEMLTRNLLKLDNIETEGKENIRQARKEAIKCIQKCINVLEAKAEKGNATPQPQDVEMKNVDEKTAEQETVQNGDVEMKEPPKEVKSEPQVEQESQQPQLQEKEIKKSEPEQTTATEPVTAEQAPVKNESTQKIESNPPEVVPDNQPETEKAPLEPVKPETQNPQVTDTRPTDTKTPEPETKLETKEKKSPKKVTKVVKKRDKSKDKTAKDVEDTAKKDAVKDNKETETVDKDSNKKESLDKIESVISKGNGDCMEVDAAASQ